MSPGLSIGVRAILETLLAHDTESAGSTRPSCRHITFNPITKRELAGAIGDRMDVFERTGGATDVLGKEQVNELVDEACGDMRYAMLLVGIRCRHGSDLINSIDEFDRDHDAIIAHDARVPISSSTKKRRRNDASGPGSTVVAPRAQEATRSMFAKDASLGLFHGVAKFLYNKRRPRIAHRLRHRDDSDDDKDNDVPSDSWLATRFRRLEPESDVEAVLANARMDFSTVASFMFENYVDFIGSAGSGSGDDVTAAAGTADALSSADVIYCTGSRSDVNDGDTDAELVNVPAAIGAIVSARGAMFHMSEPPDDDDGESAPMGKSGGAGGKATASSRSFRSLRGPRALLCGNTAASAAGARRAERRLALTVMPLGFARQGGSASARLGLLPYVRRMEQLGGPVFMDSIREY